MFHQMVSKATLLGLPQIWITCNFRKKDRKSKKATKVSFLRKKFKLIFRFLISQITKISQICLWKSQISSQTSRAQFSQPFTTNQYWPSLQVLVRELRWNHNWRIITSLKKNQNRKKPKWYQFRNNMLMMINFGLKSLP